MEKQQCGLLVSSSMAYWFFGTYTYSDALFIIFIFYISGLKISIVGNSLIPAGKQDLKLEAIVSTLNTLELRTSLSMASKMN